MDVSVLESDKRTEREGRCEVVVSDGGDCGGGGGDSSGRHDGVEVVVKGRDR